MTLSVFYQEIVNFCIFTRDIKMGRISQQIRLFNLPFPRVTETFICSLSCAIFDLSVCVQ